MQLCTARCWAALPRHRALFPFQVWSLSPLLATMCSCCTYDIVVVEMVCLRYMLNTSARVLSKSQHILRQSSRRTTKLCVARSSHAWFRVWPFNRNKFVSRVETFIIGKEARGTLTRDKMPKVSAPANLFQGRVQHQAFSVLKTVLHGSKTILVAG